MFKPNLSVIKSRKIQFRLIVGLILVGVIAIHLINLTQLPVFADESIYIRWSQLIIDDWRQYLFFPLNDGKTPIFIWALVPFQLIFQDQLFAGRFLSVIVGLFQVIIIGLISKNLSLNKRTQLISMMLSAILPYWYFHHHLALMDGMLALFASVACLFSIKLASNINSKHNPKKTFMYCLLTGLFIGLSLLTKLPALLLIPSVIIAGLLIKQNTLKNWTKLLIYLCISTIIGAIIFILLKIHPAFSQLFSRGGDFLFGWQEILYESRWKETLPSIPNYLNYFIHYLTWPVIFLGILGVFLKKKRAVILLHLSWLSFAFPIFIMGRVVFARYLFPVSIFITLAASISIGELLKMKSVIKYVIYLLLMLTVIKSLQFITPTLLAPEKIPFVPSDQKQHLTEWSAGFGVKDTVELIRDLASTQTVYVFSEGYFGTLPDGLLMYLHQQPVNNIFIQPIGQPIRNLPTPSNIDKLNPFDLYLLVGNSHRLQLNLDGAKLIYESCRPFDAPCHQVWDITNLIDSLRNQS